MPSAAAARTAVTSIVRFTMAYLNSRAAPFGPNRCLSCRMELSVKQERVAIWSDAGGREAALVQRCAARDESAFAELVAEHRRAIVQLGLNLLGDEDEALDLSQEVFLTVVRK